MTLLEGNTMSKDRGASLNIADYITQQVEIQAKAGKTAREIASEMGYEKANMISMFKTGDVKVPLDKVPALAKALNVDVAFLFRLALQQYWKNENKVIASIFGGVFTDNEREIIDYIRSSGSEARHQERLGLKLVE
jgi:transcriptional regulator with XRE-family HTH domain